MADPELPKSGPAGLMIHEFWFIPRFFLPFLHHILPAN